MKFFRKSEFMTILFIFDIFKYLIKETRKNQQKREK